MAGGNIETQGQASQKTPEEKYIQEILDLKIPGINEKSDITPDLLEKYVRWRKTNEKLDALESRNITSIAKFEETLDTSRENSTPNVETPEVPATESGKPPENKFSEDALTQELKGKIDTLLGENPLGKVSKFFGFDLSTWIIENGKKYYSENASGIGKMVFGFFMGIIGISGAEGLFKDYSQGISQLGTPSPNPPDSTVAEAIASNILPLSPEIKTSPDIYALVGETFFLQVTGEIYSESHNKGPLLKHLQDKPWKELQFAYSEYLENSKNSPEEAIEKLFSRLGIDQSKYNKTNDTQTLISLLNSLAGPIPISLITERVTLEKVGNLIESGKIKEKFGESFEKEIKGKSIEELNFKQISIIYTLLFPAIITQKIDAGKNFVLNFLFGDDSDNALSALKDEFDQKRSSLLSPETYETILTQGSGNVYISNPDEFKKAFSNKIPKNELDSLISFQEKFLGGIIGNEKYTLGYTGFQEEFSKRVSYQDIIMMYTFLNGNPDLGHLDNLASSTVYLWINGVLGGNKEYLAKLVLQVGEETNSYLSDVQKEILRKQLLRTSKTFTDIFFKNYTIVSGGVRATIAKVAKDEFGVEDISQGTLDEMEWGIIISILGAGGAIMYIPHPAFKVLGFMAMGVGGTYGLSKLYEKGTFGKLEKDYHNEEVYTLMNQVLKTVYGKSIPDIIKDQENGKTADQVFVN